MTCCAMPASIWSSATSWAVRISREATMLRDRRQFLGLLAASWAAPAFAQISSPAMQPQTRSPEMSRPTAYAFSFKRLEGGDLRLADHAGKPILVVNTASLCGFTPQYDGLQQLWTRFRDQ